MGRLFRADMRKLKKSSTLWVCTALAFLFGIVMAVLYYIVWVNIGSSVQATQQLLGQLGVEKETFETAIAQFPEPNFFEYANALLCDTNVLYFGAIVIGVFVASEYSMGTVKNTIARGFTRTKVFFSKFFSSVIAMMIVVFSYVFGGSMTSVFMFGFTSSTGKKRMLMVLLVYFSLFIAAASMFLMISVIMKKTGQAIAVSIIFPVIVESVISALTIANKSFVPIAKYWLFRTFVAAEDLCLSYRSYIPFLVAAVYTGVCLVTAYLVFRRQEFK